MSKIRIDQLAEMVLKESRGQFGDESEADLRWLLERDNWRKIAGLRTGALVARAKGQSGYEQVLAGWKDFFDAVRVGDDNPLSEFFALATDEGDEVEEYGFGKYISGLDALYEFGLINRKPASLWAQRRYVEAFSRTQEHHLLLGIGAAIPSFDGHRFPAYGWNNDGRFVIFGSLRTTYTPGCHFLLRKENVA
ncbi:hypothetical protein KKA13_00645 [Patescibacteria group bacterium]|nr:hypothetical protein [Patescibacteria group bacterium]MBU1612988.1 hypothetical protein [Patescibacteria group bacterium]